MKRSMPAVMLLAYVFITGCTNPYKQYFLSKVERWPNSVKANLLPPLDPPKLYSSTDMKADAHRLLESGYILLGRSKFESQAVDENAALQQAQTIGAWLVLVNHKYAETITQQVPIVSPQETQITKEITDENGNTRTINETDTTYVTNWVPEDFDYYNYAATYWAKTAPSPIGLLVRTPLPDPTNSGAFTKGLKVAIVITNSPAFKAMVMEGDTLITLAGEDLVSPDQFFDVVSRNAGKTVTLNLIRHNQPLSVQVSLSE